MRTLLFAVCFLALGAGCASSADDGAADGWGGSGGSGGAMSDLPSSLSIDAVEPLEARAQVDVVVQAVPPRVYRVRFSLPTSSGEPKDAVLDRTEADTDENGRATVRLTAPSSDTEFDLRASVGGSVMAATRITVNSAVSATVRVRAVKTGRRSPTTWTATIHEGKTCAEVPGVPPEDGDDPDLFAISSSQGAPEISGVPTGVPLAVTLRSGFFMGGCTSLESLPPEAADTPQVVEVTVLERPMELAASTVSLALGLAAPETTWKGVVLAAGDEVLSALRGNSENDVDALLDGKRDVLSGTAQQNLESTRSAEGWDALVQARWAGSTSKLSALVGGWLSAGAGKLTAGDSVFLGQLSPASATKAHLTLETVAGIPALDAGFVNPAIVSWSAGADDTVVLATDVYFVSSRLVTGLSQPEALVDFPAAASVSDALKTALDCTALGVDLASAGADPVLAYAGCDASCLNQLCGSALDALWERARSATAVAPARLSVTGAGNGRVGDAAELAGIVGSWVGKLSTENGEQPTGGTLTAAEPPLDAP